MITPAIYVIPNLTQPKPAWPIRGCTCLSPDLLCSPPCYQRLALAPRTMLAAVEGEDDADSLGGASSVGSSLIAELNGQASGAKRTKAEKRKEKKRRKGEKKSAETPSPQGETKEEKSTETKKKIGEPFLLEEKTTPTMETTGSGKPAASSAAASGTSAPAEENAQQTEPKAGLAPKENLKKKVAAKKGASKDSPFTTEQWALMDTLLKLVLQTTQLNRDLQGVLLDVFLVPTASSFVELASKQGKRYANATMVAGHGLGPPQIYMSSLPCSPGWPN